MVAHCAVANKQTALWHTGTGFLKFGPCLMMAGEVVMAVVKAVKAVVVVEVMAAVVVLGVGCDGW